MKGAYAVSAQTGEWKLNCREKNRETQRGLQGYNNKKQIRRLGEGYPSRHLSL
jgi:hypothetical protein